MDNDTRIIRYRSRFARALVLPAVLVLAGCPPIGKPSTSSTDGARCDAVDAKGAVYLEVSYDAAGMPAVAPEVCEVDAGTQVTWRGPTGAQALFEIHFKGASPVSRERGVFSSSMQDGRQKVRRIVDAPAGRYDYGVRANGKELDPAIIIR